MRKIFLIQFLFLAIACPTILWANLNINLDGPSYGKFGFKNVCGKSFEKTIHVCAGSTSKGRNWNGKKSSVLDLYNNQENIITGLNKLMRDIAEQTADTGLLRPDATINNPTIKAIIESSQVLPILAALAYGPIGGTGFVALTGGDAGEDLARLADKKRPLGDFNFSSIHFGGTWKTPVQNVPGKFFVSAGLPIKKFCIKNVVWDDLASDAELIEAIDRALGTGAGHAMVRQLINTQWMSISRRLIEEVGGLNIDDWSDCWAGDLAVQVGWTNDYHPGSGLEKVSIKGSLGVSCPTGKLRNEDYAYSLPMGNDGAWGAIIDIAADFTLNEYLKFGGSANLLALWEDTKLRRIRTSSEQGTYLLFEKGMVTRQAAPEWRLNAYAQMCVPRSGFSLGIGYGFMGKGNDKLRAARNPFTGSEYSTTDGGLPSGALYDNENLRKRSVHEVIFQAGYDAATGKHEEAVICPTVNVFYKIPFKGKRIITSKVLGGELNIAF